MSKLILPQWLQKKQDKERSQENKELETKAKELIDYLIEKNIKVGEFEAISQVVIRLLAKEVAKKEIKELCQ